MRRNRKQVNKLFLLGAGSSYSLTRHNRSCLSKQAPLDKEFTQRLLEMTDRHTWVKRAQQKIRNYESLVENSEIGGFPINAFLETSRDYLGLHVDELKKSTPDVVRRPFTFNMVSLILDSFREITESQLYNVFKITKTPNEEIGRTLTQAFLSGAFPIRTFQFREVPVAEGKSDNLIIILGEKYPFEVKIWKGPKYYDKGMKQIKYYMDYENVDYGFYIIFDPRKRDYKSGSEVVVYNGKRIYELFIRIKPAPSPSQ